MIIKTSYRDQVREYLLSLMLKGDLEAGNSISLSEISRQLEVSVTPIREALTQLEKARIVKSVPNKGFIISRLSVEEARNIYELISAIEALAIENSMYHNADIQSLIRIQEKFEQETDPVNKIHLDLKFHKTLTHNYKNEIAISLINDLKIRAFFYEKEYMNNEVLTSESNFSHLKIVALIQTGKLKQAAEMTKQHWALSYNHIKEENELNM